MYHLSNWSRKKRMIRSISKKLTASSRSRAPLEISCIELRCLCNLSSAILSFSSSTFYCARLLSAALSLSSASLSIALSRSVRAVTASIDSLRSLILLIAFVLSSTDLGSSLLFSLITLRFPLSFFRAPRIPCVRTLRLSACLPLCGVLPL